MRTEFMNLSSYQIQKDSYESRHNIDQILIGPIFNNISQNIKNGNLNIGRHTYAEGLALGVRQALHCGYEKIIAIEFGVAEGGGLLDLCTSAQFYRNLFNLDIQVFGFDSGEGLPEPKDYRDHPEIWKKNQYKMSNSQILKDKLPSFCQLILGNVDETLPEFIKQINDEKICFVALDFDYYTSTKSALKLFESDKNIYIPAVAIYVDDVFGLITYNPWCGAEGAINEFNEKHLHRKIHFRKDYNIPHFYTCQILDHPMRNFKETPYYPFEI